MFHALTSDSEKPADFRKTNLALQRQDRCPAFDGLADTRCMPPVPGPNLAQPTPIVPRKQRLAGLQHALGNQAVLRMLELSQTAVQPKLVVNQSRGQIQVSRNRCPSDSPCERDEPSSYRDPSGVATCNEATGNVDVMVFKEQCAGNCILQHEKTHATDLSGCCATFSACINNAADLDGRNKCRANWQSFLDANEAWSECNAYNVEGQCLTSLIHDNCNVSGGPVSEDCCATLQNELNTVTQRANFYCSQAAQLPCGLFFR
jgi:hypothetical protein